MIDNSGARRSINKRNALALAQLGLAVFPSSGKVPLIPRYNKLDTEITPEERADVIEKYREEHDADPIHVGATKDPDTIKRMWRAHRDAVPSVSCGPSKLVVLDADSKDDGPEKLGKLFEANGGVPEGVFVNNTRSGGQHHIYSDADGEFTNRAGLLKKNYGTDVRGIGGQFVAPGSIREDGKTYGTEKDLAAFCRAIVNKTLPPLPGFVRELIAVGGADATTHEEVAPSKEREVIQTLREVDWPEFEDVFDGVLGEYDLAKLAMVDSDFNKLYTDPSSDTSTNRFLAARALMREWPNMPPEHLAVFFEHWEGAGTITDEKPRSGEYDLRQIAREWIKNQGLEKPSNGDAFEAVVDDDEDAEYERERAEEKQREKDSVLKRATLRFMSEVAIYGEPPYIVENVFTPGMVGMLHGESNVGKTFVAIHLGGCICEGWQFFDRNVEQSGVVYCYGEGHSGIQNRLVAWKKKYTPDTDGIIVRDGIPNLGMHGPKQAIKALRKTVADANAMLRAKGLPDVRLLFLDTFAKAVAGANENDVKDMQPILNALRDLAVELNVCICIVHHSGKDSSLGARGSSAIKADVDFNLEIINATEAKKRKLTIKPQNLAIVMPKMRDSAKSGRFEFSLEEMTLGTNKWGNPVTSVVMAPIVDKPSEGSALEAVDDEAPATADELTPDQNREAEVKRMALCGTILKALREHGKLVNTHDLEAPVQVVLKHVPALRRIKEEGGSKNFARNMRAAVFDGEPRTLLDEGWLHFQPASGKKDSTIIFRPHRNAS